MGVLVNDRAASAPKLDALLSEACFAEYVDEIRQTAPPNLSVLVPLLLVSHSVFSGRSVSAATRMRGYVLAAFHNTELPDVAIPYIVEILETSTRPILVAAAARAIRGAKIPKPDLTDHLVHSIYNVWQIDQPVSFESYDVTWPLANFSTALTEVFDTLSWLGRDACHVLPALESLLTDFSHLFGPSNRAALIKCVEGMRAFSEVPRSCCVPSARVETEDENWAQDPSLNGITLEDQDGQRFLWRDYFHGKPSIVAFFYAKCQNPRKCVQTIYNLVDIHRNLTEAGMGERVRVAAITYEPDRDTAEILKQYGKSKKARFDTNFKFLRVPTKFARVIHGFQLGVNYVSLQVNDHQIELYVLDHCGSIAGQFLRLQANPESVIDYLLKITADSAMHD